MLLAFSSWVGYFLVFLCKEFKLFQTLKIPNCYEKKPMLIVKAVFSNNYSYLYILVLIFQ